VASTQKPYYKEGLTITQKFIKHRLVAIILALFVVKSSRVDSFKDTSFICGGGLLGLQEFKPRLCIYNDNLSQIPVGIMNYQLWTIQIQLLNLLSPNSFYLNNKRYGNKF
jgi:hypothetical protein